VPTQKTSTLVGVFGRITSWKGQDVFLRAIAKTPDVHAIIVGDALFGEDKYKDSLIALTKELNIEDRVTFTGHVDNVATLMAACDIITHCSTLPEPFGLVTAEATATNTPVIASDAGGSQEIIKHMERGQLTPIGDHDALADAIQLCLNNPDQATKMANAAQQYTKENFSITTMKLNFMKVLKKTIKA